jgi:hypothetical protein
MISRIYMLFTAVSNKQKPSDRRTVSQIVINPFSLPAFRDLHFLPVKSLLSQPLYVFSPIRKTSRKYIFTQRNQIKRIQ